MELVIDMGIEEHIKKLAEMSGVSTENVKLAHAFFWAIFLPHNYCVEHKGKTYYPSISKNKLLRQFKCDDYLFIEQNPNTKSKWAKRAKDGDNIMWVIRQSTGEYLARVVNGEIKLLKNNK